MGKELPGKSSSVAADEMVTSKVVDKTPGKATKDDGAVVPDYNLLSPQQRSEKLANLKHRITAAGARCNDGMQAVKIHTLLKKPEDIHWIFSLVLDVASNAVMGWAMKSLIGFKTGKIKDYASKSHDAVQVGDYEVADKADARKSIYAAISDETIKNRIGLLGGLAKAQAKPVMAAALADSDDKAEKLSYIGQLQQAMDLAFQKLNEEGTQGLTDPELNVLFEAMDVRHHSSEFYERAITAKVDRFMKSGVDTIGKGRRLGGIDDPLRHHEPVGDIETEKHVAWVQHPDRSRSLWYYEKAGSHSNARSHELALKQGMDDKFRLTKPVPQEFWEEAVLRHEVATGMKARTLADSPETRHALGVRPDHAASMSGAKVSAAQKDEQAAQAAHVVKLFGGN